MFFFRLKLNRMTCDIVCGAIIHTQHKNIILFLSLSLSHTHTHTLTTSRTYTHWLSTNVFFLNLNCSFSIPFFVLLSGHLKNRLRCNFQYTPISLISFPFPSLTLPSSTPNTQPTPQHLQLPLLPHFELEI